MAQIKLRSDSFNRWFEDWLKKYFPLADRLIRYLMGQLQPIEDPKSRQAANLFIYFLIALSVIMLILSIWQKR